MQHVYALIILLLMLLAFIVYAFDATSVAYNWRYSDYDCFRIYSRGFLMEANQRMVMG
jgi:hypothetical protein